MFKVFNKKGNGVLDKQEFCEGICLLFSSSFELSLEFVFNLFDFNGDGIISHRDIAFFLARLGFLKIPELTAFRKANDKIETNTVK